MKNVFWFWLFPALILLTSQFFGCSNKFSQTEIEVLGIKKLPQDWPKGSPALELTLGSSQNLIKIYQEEDASSLYLHCSCEKSTLAGLGGEPAHPEITSYLFLTDTVITPETGNGRYYVEVPIAFQDPSRGQLLNLIEVRGVLIKEDQIECEMVMAHMPPLPTYRSQPFYLRAEDLLKALGK
jgi:hypothetical protein